MMLRTLWRLIFMVVVLSALLLTSFGAVRAQPSAARYAPAKLASVLNHSGVSLAFVANVGSVATSVRFETRVNNKSALFMSDGVGLNLPASLSQADLMACANPNMQASAAPLLVTRSLLRLTFDDAATNPPIDGLGQLPGFANGDPIQSRSSGSAYAGVVYRGLYPGVDLTFAGPDGKLVATFTLAAGIAPSHIAWHYEGVDSTYIDLATGDLHIYTADGGLLNNYVPVAWQVRNGLRTTVTVGYQVTPDNEIRLNAPLAAYDPQLPLSIAVTVN